LLAFAFFLVLMVVAELWSVRGKGSPWSWPKFPAANEQLRSLLEHSAESPTASAAVSASLPVAVLESPPAKILPAELNPAVCVDRPEAAAADVWQQTTRTRTAEGELITGWVKAEFQPGERTAILHVAFCPP